MNYRTWGHSAPQTEATQTFFWGHKQAQTKHKQIRLCGVHLEHDLRMINKYNFNSLSKSNKLLPVQTKHKQTRLFGVNLEWAEWFQNENYLFSKTTEGAQTTIFFVNLEHVGLLSDVIVYYNVLYFKTQASQTKIIAGTNEAQILMSSNRSDSGLWWSEEFKWRTHFCCYYREAALKHSVLSLHIFCTIKGDLRIPGF